MENTGCELVAPPCKGRVSDFPIIRCKRLGLPMLVGEVT